MTSTNLDIEALLAQAGERTLESALFNIAHAYARSGELASQAIFSTKDGDFAGPAIMCKSFAVELLLKFFIVIAHPAARTYTELKAMGVNLNGHRYTTLFDKIGEEYKNKICSAFSCASFRQIDPQTFSDILAEIGDDPFVQWRYIYEKEGTQHFNIQLFEVVLNTLGKTAEVERRRLAQVRADSRLDS